MKNIRKIFIVMVALVAVSSCDLNQLDNPSKLTAASADPDLLLNQVQIFTVDVFNQASEYGMEMTRMDHFYGPNFENGFTPLTFDYTWTTAYSNVLINSATLLPLADDGTANSKKLYMHTGMTKVLSAYVAMTLVDMFGDIPYSEALKATNLNPKADTGASIYAASIAQLDDAILDFGKSESKKPYDLYYGGNKARWITLANTLKLRALMTTRLVDPTAAAKIQTLVTANDLIDTDAENFVYKYSTNIANPDSRHPNFSGNYLTGAGTFHTNWLMYNMVYDKSNVAGTIPTANIMEAIDPRTRYYYYRQNSQVTKDVNLISCLPRPKVAHYYADPRWPFCTLKNPFDGEDLGYWGRDFADATGVNPDTQSRTNWGVYPIGGKFDDLTLVPNPDFVDPAVDYRYQGSKYVKEVKVGGVVTVKGVQDPVPNTSTDGLQGAGIAPMWLASFTEFLKAEAANVGAVAGGDAAAGAFLDAGVAKSITYVMAFGAGAAAGAANVPSAGAITNYKNTVSARYAAAATGAPKRDVIMKEFWIALFGNGLDTYNNYRRTGMPLAMQPPLSPNPGVYYRSFTYPSVYVTRNANATQKTSDGVQVFWDNNPAGFIK